MAQKAPQTPKEQAQGCLVLIVLFLLCWAGCKMCGNDDEKEPSKYSRVVLAADLTDTQVWIMAQAFTKTFLKAPATADFPLEAIRVKRDADTFEVVGYVDAQNSYGALLRSDLICNMAYLGGDWSDAKSWQLRFFILGDDIVFDEVGLADKMKALTK